jgi:hypothetical protein
MARGQRDEQLSFRIFQVNRRDAAATATDDVGVGRLPQPHRNVPLRRGKEAGEFGSRRRGSPARWTPSGATGGH